MTVYRRRDLGMVDFDEATRYVSDNELQRLLQVMRQEMPNLGEALVIGQLHATFPGEGFVMRYMLLIL